MDLPERAQIGLEGSWADITISPEDTSLITDTETTFPAEVHRSTDGAYILYVSEGMIDATGFDDPTEAGEAQRTKNGVFVFYQNEFAYEFDGHRPLGGAIADDGTAIILDDPLEKEAEEHNTTAFVLNDDKDIILSEEFETFPSSVTISPDGEYAACADGNNVFIFDIAEGTTIWHESETDQVIDIEFREDGAHIVDIYDDTNKSAAYSIDVAGEKVDSGGSAAERIPQDVDDLVQTIETADGKELGAAWNELIKAVRSAPEAVDDDHVTRLLEAVYAGRFLSDASEYRLEQRGLVVGLAHSDSDSWGAHPESVFRTLANETPEKLVPHADRIVNLLEEDDKFLVEVAGSTLLSLFKETHRQLNSDAMDPYVSDIARLLRSDDEIVREQASVAQKGIDTAERWGHEYPDTSDEQDRSAIQVQRLRSESDPEQLKDVLNSVRSSLRNGSLAPSEQGDLVSLVLELTEQHEPDLTYGETDGYDYRDNAHYSQYYVLKHGLRVLEELAPHHPQAFTGAYERLLRYANTAGDRNKNIYGAAIAILRKLAKTDSDLFVDSVEAHKEDFFRLIDSVESEHTSTRVFRLCHHYATVDPAALKPVLPTLVTHLECDPAYSALQQIGKEVPSALGTEYEALVDLLGSDEAVVRQRATSLLNLLAEGGELGDSELQDLVAILQEGTQQAALQRDILQVVAKGTSSGGHLNADTWAHLETLSEDDDWQIREAVAEIAVTSNDQRRDPILDKLAQDPIPDVQDVAQEQ